MKILINYIIIMLLGVGMLHAQTKPAKNTTTAKSAATICCPQFTIQGFEPCDPNQECRDSTASHQNPTGGSDFPGTPGQQQPAPAKLIACKNSAIAYSVFPNLPGYSYTWSVIGGTVINPNVNPANINWGGGNTGSIQVIISNSDGTCKDTIKRRVCLLNSPQASFTFTSPTCVGGTVCFNSSASTGSGNTYYWDFGDGNNSTLPNPCHVYSTAGTYNVILKISTISGPGKRDCGCSDTIQKQIVISNKPPIDIHAVNCKKMLCFGDTVKYCTNTTGCSGLTWSTNGGTIISGQGTTCATIVWNQPIGNSLPSVTLNANCAGTCSNTNTLTVPVLYPNLPIQGSNVVCANSTTAYSLPALPGTFYYWSLSSGGSIISADSNHNVVSVNWNGTGVGPHILTCNYNNPYTGCKGTDTIGVYIRPPFTLSGVSAACTTVPYNYFAPGNVSSWSFNPAASGMFTATPIGATGQNVVWNVPGSYTITAIPANPSMFCTPNAVLNITVNPKPVLNPITGPNTVCKGTLYNYSVTSNVPGGNFVWNVFPIGSGTVSAYGTNNSNAGIIFGGTGSSWTVGVQQTVNGCTGIANIAVAQVAPPAAPALSAATTCSGSTITATAALPIPTGGYTWSATPGAALISASGNTATFTVNDNATITVANCSGSASANVTVNPATVTLNQSLATCGVTITATASGTPVSYTWYLNGVLVAGPSGSNTYNASVNGNYTVKVLYSNGCFANGQITVNSITPVITYASGTGSICNGGTVTLQGSISANCSGATYVWSNGATGATTTVTTPGAYTVTVTCSNGCTYTSNPVIVGACSSPGGSCTNDVVISNSNCPNPVNLTATWPSGCTPAGVNWYWGDGTLPTTTNTHTYTGVGTFQVWVSGYCGSTPHCGTQAITVPMVDSFTVVTTCNGSTGWVAQLQDASMYLPAYAGYTRTWSTTCGTLSSTTSANPTLTIPFGCNPTVTLTITKNGCTLTKSFTFGLPTTALAIVGTFTDCINQNYNFSSNYNTNIVAYNWNFGDATTASSATNGVIHAFNGTPNNPVITMTLTDTYGCQWTATQAITLVQAPALTITPGPIVKICLDCTTPVVLSTNPTSGFNNYQWYYNGAPITGATNATLQICNASTTGNVSGNYHVTATSTANSCNEISDTVKVIYHPKPVANIKGSGTVCGGTAAPYSFSLENAPGYNVNYTYNWSGSGPGTVSFNPNNTLYQVNVDVSATGLYQFVLKVTDTTGCIAKDTLCVYVYQTPTVSVSAPANMCEGTSYTMTATAATGLLYQWSNGATTPSITTAEPGSYTVTVTDPVSGCNATAFAGTIHIKPYVALFPMGCDTLCDTTTKVIIPPLPLMPGATYGTTYVIKWYLDNAYHSTAPSFSLAGLAVGAHTIYIEVTDLNNNCVSTSNTFNVYIKSCKGCNCKESKWESIVLNLGEAIPTDGKGKTKNVSIPQDGGTKLECKGAYELKCKQTYNIAAIFNCPDEACPPKITYNLLLPNGSNVSGNAPINITPTQNGLYTLTMYGWCGNKICDSCVLYFKVNDCKDTTDCCKGSLWATAPYYYFETKGKPIPTKIDCNKETVVYINGEYCKRPLVIGGVIKCPEPCLGRNEVVVYDENGNVVSSGAAPYTLPTLPNGAYTVVVNGYCGSSLCLTCKFIVKVDCPDTPPVDCNCRGSKWGDKVLTQAGTSKPISCQIADKQYDLKCNVPATLNANYICAGEECPGTVTYSMTSSMGTTTGTMPLNFTPSVSGIYVVTMYGMCNGKVCDSCRIRIKVECPPSPCCPVEIVVKPTETNYSTLPNATVLQQGFTINGLGTTTLTEVRAEVVSYTLQDNFNSECLKCVNLPYSWASIYKAGNIATVSPKITMFGTSVPPPFTGTGAQAYQNPREIIWNNGSSFIIPNGTNVGMSFLLPLPPSITCCEIKGKICVRFIFRDKDCKECEALVCFDVAIPKK
jgi:hypothetical protein